ncbi:MAG: amidase family protein, partial [Cellvibrionaceae bacterium]|nr:amidase family protein [Cellvibrionaceae bacterium]
SSGGSAALVASGVVPIAHANDGAGSIRIPAACCGLVGLKPSRGRLPAKPVPGYLPPNIFHEGVLSRSVRDTAAFYAAVEQQQGSEGLKPIGELQGPPAKRLKIALLTENCRGVDCDSQLLKAAHGAGALCEGLGHHVELISNPFYAGFDDDFWLLWSHMAFAVRYASKIVVKQTLESDKLQAWAKYLVSYHWKNLHRVPAAFRRLSRFVGQYQQFMANYDVLLSPTLGAPTPKLGYFGPAVPGRIHMDRKYPFIPFTKYQNISGAPAISLPMGVCASGLPLGIQFAAGLGEERTLLALALELEQAQPWQSLASPATAVQP